MQGEPVTLGIRVDVGPDADPEEVAEATLRLRRELLDLDATVELARAGEPPPGARAVELAALGTLMLTIAQPDLLAAVVTAVKSWRGSAQHRSVRLELDGDVLELTGVSTSEQRRLADAWLRRHQGR